MEDERRRTPRYPFAAAVELIQGHAKAGISARITELSLYGCYVEMPDPLEKGTEIFLKVYANGKFFESYAVVAYQNAAKGIGACFQNVNPHYLAVLKQWLIEAAHSRFGKKD
jgi:hypothetical protein